MGYDAERGAITAYLNAQSYFGITPFGLDGEPEEMTDGAGFMEITNGQGRQVSTGAPGANLHGYVGVLQITLVHTTSRLARALADSVVDGLTGLKIDETGAVVSAGSTEVIDFSARGLVPYLARGWRETPYYRVLVNAPFLRSERK